MTHVTLVTANATAPDALTDEDYRDIFTELRQNLSLDKLIGVMGSQYSKAVWSRYERGDYALTRQMRNELRRAVGQPELSLTVADAVAQHTDPDASVWTVGGGMARHVVLVGHGDAITLHVNGGVTEVPSVPCNYSNTALFSTEDSQEYVGTENAQRTQIGAVLRRRRLVRPVASHTQDERRAALGVAWRDVIDAGLDALSK